MNDYLMTGTLPVAQVPLIAHAVSPYFSCSASKADACFHSVPYAWAYTTQSASCVCIHSMPSYLDLHALAQAACSKLLDTEPVQPYLCNTRALSCCGCWGLGWAVLPAWQSPTALE